MTEAEYDIQQDTGAVDPAEADIDAVLYEFKGDARAAIRALLSDLAVLAGDADSARPLGRRLRLVPAGRDSGLAPEAEGDRRPLVTEPMPAGKSALAVLMIGRRTDEVAERLDAWRVDRLEPRVTAADIRTWLLGDDPIPAWVETAIACELRYDEASGRLAAEMALQRAMAKDAIP